MADTGPAVILDPPPLTPPPNGLLKAATVIDHTDDVEDSRWINGIKFQPESFDDITSFDPCGGTSDIISSFTDGVTNTDTSLVSATANFASTDVGKTVTGSGIPGGTTISSVTNPTTVVLSAATTATATGVTFTIANRISQPNGGGTRFIHPFGLQAEQTCSAFTPAADWEGRARRRLAAQESKGVEKEFTLATIKPANPHLQDNTNTVKLNGGTAVGLRQGLELLVQAIADHNLGIGMIHARPGLITAWSGIPDLLVIQNGKLYTYNGNLIVSGSGYTGAAPDHTAASSTSEWAYATEVLQVHRGPVEVFTPSPASNQNMDINANSVTIRAQRMYAIVGNFPAIYTVQINPTTIT